MATNFYGFDHVDTRVRSLAAVEPFYDLLMPRLGLVRKRYANVDGDEWSDAEPGGAYNAVEFYQERTGEGAPFFIGLIEDRAMQPTRTRIAFRVPRAELDGWRGFLAEIGACNVEPSADPEAYPAIFFEDPAGTKLEVCARK